MLTFEVFVSELEGLCRYDFGAMAAADSESSGGGHQLRGRTSNPKRHRTTSLSPPNHTLKRSRSPSFDKYRERKTSRKHGRHGDREDRDRKGGTERKLNAILETNGEREEKEVIRRALPEAEEDGEGEREPIRVRRTHSEAWKSEKSDTAGDDSSEDSEGEEVSESERRRKKRRADRHGEKKSKRRHRPVESDSEVSGTEATSAESSEDSEDERRRAKRRKRRKQKERDERERDKEDDRRRKEKKRKLKEKERKLEKSRKKKEKVVKRAKGPITESWGKYGIIKEIDMWTKRPEFSAWLAEVKKVNLEILTNREEKDMFKQYMEDYNTATFPSKKYYNVDIYHRRKTTKMRLKNMRLLAKQKTERTEFNDEEQRRLELMSERAKQKEAELETLKRSMMQSGMGQAMREQAVLREEMQYHYRVGNAEAAAAIQRRLEPDVPGALH